MTDIFDGYERQYCELSTNLARKCTNVGTLEGELKKQKLKDLNDGVQEAETLIRKMDLEARSLQPTQKAALLAKLREYKSDLNNLKRDVKKSAAMDSAASRDERLESGRAAILEASGDQRAQLLAATERVIQTGDRIKDSRRTLLETEELGVSILQDLHQQRQSLLHSQNTLHGVDDGLSKSRKILNSMGRRMNRNKWAMWTVIAALILSIGLILYFKLKRR
eukprot:TRINITY_DN17428_c0_g1_i1.p1 TRINITY_DN17428_c0_g1~~TRINITY_DN17428_c0_g1_i1.p1  ORF type:complete len:222 (+),score=47.63 TRINITY_DN17428_c0_g1_i1:252-917(+)